MKKIIAIVLVLCTVLCMAACGAPKQEAKKLDASALCAEIVEKTASPANFTLTEDQMMNIFGIDSADCVQAVVAMCEVSLNVDEIWIIETKDETAAQEYLGYAQTRIDQKCMENENYLPDQYEVAKQAKAIQNGCYVALFVSPEVDTMVEMFNAAIG